jgi:hypothetical protein
MGIKAKMGDQFVSVEHLVLALADDVRFGEALFKAEGLTAKKIEAAVKEVSRCCLFGYVACSMVGGCIIQGGWAVVVCVCWHWLMMYAVVRPCSRLRG